MSWLFMSVITDYNDDDNSLNSDYDNGIVDGDSSISSIIAQEQDDIDDRPEKTLFDRKNDENGEGGEEGEREGHRTGEHLVRMVVRIIKMARWQQNNLPEREW